ncbi:MAG: NAD-dependent epimerase/dehydratase family protein [Janthinobacterium lividum]
MKILLIGGTGFLGQHLVTAAQMQQHEVTLFHRGNHPWEGLADVEEIYGDRSGDLGALKNRQWDAVIDTCGYLPQTVSTVAETLRGSVAQYVFLSSVAAYADFRTVNYRETAPLATLTATQAARTARLDVNVTLTASGLADLYGPLKVLCEQQAQRVFGNDTLVVRPGLLVGPHNRTDRFTYWVQRVAAGGNVLAPGRPNRFVQFIDARDVADWIIGMIASQKSGVYNVTGHPFALSFGELLETIKAVTNSQAAFTWVTEDFLQQEQVEEWLELPLYLSESTREMASFMSANIEGALAEGLHFRPLGITIQDTLAWRATLPDHLRAGLAINREQQLLAKYAVR